VKNLVSHDKGNTFKTILRTLDELDYDVSYRVINAKGWVPQHRQRIFIVGFRRDLGVDFNLDDMQVPDPNEGPKLKTILLSSKKVDDKYTLSEKLWNYLQGYAAKHKAAGNGFGFGLVGANDTARTLSARYYKDGSEILVKQAGTKRPRRLTPRECARLMGFDKPGGKEFEIVVSDTQAYKQFGNAVVVPVVEAIAEYMKPTMLDLILKHGKESARPPKNLLQTDLFEPVAEYA